MSSFQGFPPDYAPMVGYPSNRRRAVFQVQQGDTLPAVEYALAGNDLDASHLNLAGASVDFVFYQLKSDSAVTTKTAEIVDAETNRVRYQWQAGDTDTPGDYVCEFKVTYADGAVLTFPRGGVLTLEILGGLT